MCGIAGLLGPQLTRESLGAQALRMGTALRHRGPDDQGVWTGDPYVALAHRRLSIIDLSHFGHQPMVSKSGRFVLTYNGEIYNFLELRARLASEAQFEFAGNSDTEVLLAAIET